MAKELVLLSKEKYDSLMTYNESSKSNIMSSENIKLNQLPNSALSDIVAKENNVTLIKGIVHQDGAGGVRG